MHQSKNHSTLRSVIKRKSAMSLAKDERARGNPHSGARSDPGDIRATGTPLFRGFAQYLNPGSPSVISRSWVRAVWKTVIPRRALVYLRLARSALSRLEARHQRLFAWSLVAGLHLGLVTLLLMGLVLHWTQTPEPSIQVTLGGPLGAPTHLPPAEPTLFAPDLPQITEPSVDTAVEDANLLGGSQNVTRPAEAIAEHHEFPTTPTLDAAHRAATVRLLVSVSEEGTVSDAEVLDSSGLPFLDSLAIQWVKQRWLYRPALRNGAPIAVTTTAIIKFVSGS